MKKKPHKHTSKSLVGVHYKSRRNFVQHAPNNEKVENKNNRRPRHGRDMRSNCMSAVGQDMRVDYVRLKSYEYVCIGSFVFH